MGWSFLKDPANELGSCYQQLSERAWTSRPGLMVGGQWSQPRLDEYVQLAARFSRLLLVCIHFSGGMPGRTTEVATVRYQNSRQVMRNVFAYNGRLAIITEYHKARSRTNHAFYVVRFLPRLVSEILFRYLAYVRPFANSLVNEDEVLQPEPQRLLVLLLAAQTAHWRFLQGTASPGPPNRSPLRSRSRLRRRARPPLAWLHTGRS